jgi:hypothetical protein
MQLTEQDKKRILEWINAKCGGMRCTCCGVGNWALNDHATILLGIDIHSTRFFYHAGLPAVSFICVNCGHITFFSSGVIGFKPDQPAVAPVEEVLKPIEGPPSAKPPTEP